MMKLHSKNLFYIAVFVLMLIPSYNSFALLPVPTDSRIKTLIYNENDVFHIVVHYGYQSSIEFAKNEKIEATSLGSSYAWRYSIVGRRLFINALEGSARTNMTVITNRRTYYFDLESKDPSDGVDDELVYVVRFFYPNKQFGTHTPKIDTKAFLPDNLSPTAVLNFNYSLSGPETIAPVKVFDDGKFTYLKFRNNNANIPNIFIVDKKIGEIRTSYSRKGDYIVIKRPIQELALRLNNEVVTVYNESNAGGN